MTTSLVRLCFCLAVAILAAALADPLVELASNAGWFGGGNFTDHSNLDVLPAATAGLFALLLHCALRLRRAIGRRGARRERWLQISNNAFGRSAARLLPAIFALQVVALFAMESSEQLLTRGHLLGGTIWLGGPVAVSILAHALACILVTIAVSRLVQAFARTASRVIRFIRAFRCLDARAAVSVFRRNAPRGARFDFALFLRGLAKRAPPFLHA